MAAGGDYPFLPGFGLRQIASQELKERARHRLFQRLKIGAQVICPHCGAPHAAAYELSASDDDEFFYRGGGIRLRKTPETDCYFQYLTSLLSPPQSAPSAEKSLGPDEPCQPKTPMDLFQHERSSHPLQ